MNPFSFFQSRNWKGKASRLQSLGNRPCLQPSLGPGPRARRLWQRTKPEDPRQAAQLPCLSQKAGANCCTAEQQGKALASAGAGAGAEARSRGACAGRGSGLNRPHPATGAPGHGSLYPDHCLLPGRTRGLQRRNPRLSCSGGCRRHGALGPETEPLCCCCRPRHCRRRRCCLCCCYRELSS